ncbi:hypothetical protein [Pseudomonas aeruginosa]|uniref:hypothetical protein n=2 Tax=Pseudomonas aeruginosa TaxID=287 RepID=UPI0029C098FD|nr:hypothetical protein [Pseudomonas aeruginosa]
MSNELTDVRCPCGAEFQADSYDAGFIAGSGMCQNCDAALPTKDICTCPSGDGSLRHPCPAHIGPFDKLVGSPVHNESEPDLPPLDEHLAQVFETGMALSESVEQAGGDERDFQAKGAQEVPSPVSKEYDRHLIGLLRKGEALPGHQEEAADEIERLRDWNDHLNNTVLPNILNPNFLMLMKGGERLLDLCTKDGKFIGVSLNDMKDVFDWMVTHARIAPDHAALAQPSPKCEFCGGTGEISGVEGEYDWVNGPCPRCAYPAQAQAEQAEAERPEVVGYLATAEHPKHGQPHKAFNYFKDQHDAQVAHWRERGCEVSDDELMTVAQHERIVGVLRAKIAQLRQHKNDYMDAGQETYRALQNEIREREAEIARLDGLVSGHTAERDAALARVAELELKLDQSDYAYDNDRHHMRGMAKQAAEAIQVFTGHDSGANLAHRYGEKWWEHLDELRDALLAFAKNAPPAQAQHSVPETINEEANSFLRIADAGQFKDNAVAVRTAAVIIRGLLHRPAIMKSIIRHRIGLTPEYEGQWHADLYGEDGEVQHHAEADTPDEAVRAVVALAAAPGKEEV